MCLILFAYHSHPNYRLVLAANRDEFFNRPSAPLAFWEDHRNVLAGRDLKLMGTWMGVTRTGRFAAITNYREPGRQNLEAPSRGHLISDYLIGTNLPGEYLDSIQSRAPALNGFNVLVGDSSDLYYYSNRGGPATRLAPGIYGLSNRLLDTDWPKVGRGKRRLAALLENHDELHTEGLFEILSDQQTPPDDRLPDTGVGMAWERLLAPMFITSPTYGTRCSTILTIDRSDAVRITEMTWEPAQSKPLPRQKQEFEFKIET